MREGREETVGVCLRFERELESHLEGESRPFVAGHAQECFSCRALLSDLELIRLAARELPMLEPSPVIWANVRAQLEAEGIFRPHGERGWRRLLTWWAIPHPVPMGALAVLVVLGMLLTLPPHTGLRWDAPEEAAISSVPGPAPSLAAVASSEDRALAGLVEELESNYRANATALAPELKATYEKSLVSLNDSIRECQDSLAQEPRNSLAHEYLLTAYTRKAEILSAALEFEGR